jgi:hypothetical protein
MDIADLAFRYVGAHRRASLRDVLASRPGSTPNAPPWRRWPTTPKTCNVDMAFEPEVALLRSN